MCSYYFLAEVFAKKRKYRDQKSMFKIISLFPLGFNHQVLDDQWLYLLAIDSNVHGRGTCVAECGGLRVDDQINPSFGVNPAHISGIEFHERGLALVKLDLGLALEEGLSCSVFVDPIGFGSRHSTAKVEDIY